MLKAHIDAVEASLLQTSQIPANTGHTLHRGTPREAFIRQFLNGHLSERVAIGTGEIIDAQSQPRQQRNQIDIVIYKREYPKLDFGGGINGFLAESVVATIEVKSLLDKAELQTSTTSARNIKALTRSVTTAFSAGYQPPAILSYVVAYSGPASMQTVHGWLPSISAQTGVTYPRLPSDEMQRIQMPSPALDGVFILGRGFMHFGNTPMGFFAPGMLAQNADAKWAIADTQSGSLLLLFMFLTMAVSGSSGAWLNPNPYLTNFSVQGLAYGT